MNFSHRVGIVSALLAVVAAGASLADAQSSQPKSAYYQTISIDGVLKSKPAIIYVSPKYQVTLMVNGREITGVSLELSKQKLFSVTLAENHRMIFLDTLTSRGQADLNLILDDEQVLPVHLMVKDSPTGTRIYTFETADDTGEADVPAPAPAPAAKSPVTSAPAPTAKPAVAPAPAPQSTRQSAPSPVVPTSSVKPSTPAATRPNSSVPAAPPVSPTASAATYQNAKMGVEVVKVKNDATITLRLTSPTGQALRADISNLRLYDGSKIVPYTVEQGARGRLLPINVIVKVSNVPANLMVSWPVTSIVPSRQYTLRSQVKVD
ncbi:hypothetical protein [Deinococcus saxicola]|uniref:hypothetical protein n=1 Tax=Deinococcus saxicola TaxID=249406 RepID=UPI0039EE5897